MTDDEKSQQTPEQLAVEALPDSNPLKELSKRIADLDAGFTPEEREMARALGF
jgi:hypothetical protein